MISTGVTKSDSFGSQFPLCARDRCVLETISSTDTTIDRAHDGKVFCWCEHIVEIL